MLDLGDTNHTVIEIDNAGWRKTSIEIPPFYRTKDQAAFPYPDASGDFNKMKQFLSFRDDIDQTIAQIFVATVPFIEFERPILVIYGPPSSGKSKTTHILRDIADPQNKPPGDMPTDKKALMINLFESCLPAFDNANEIIPEGSQSLFSGSVTGFSHKERRLFSNFEAAHISFRRPSIVNGLTVPFSKPDLLSRCLLIKAEKISTEIDPSVLRENFEKDRSSILGGMLNTLSIALKILPQVKPIPPDLTRFRDWARAAIAVGIALGIPRERFLDMLAELKQRGARHVATVDPVCEAIRFLMANPRHWKVRNKDVTPQMWVGTVTELLGELELVAHSYRIDTKRFPKGAAQLGMSLDNIASVLKSWNITLKRDEERTGKNRDRFVRIEQGSGEMENYHEPAQLLLAK